MTDTAMSEDLPDREEMAAAFADAANANAGRRAPAPWVAQPDLLTDEQCEAWVRDGFFVVRGLVDAATCDDVNRRSVDLVRTITATGEAMGNNYATEDQFVVGEHNFSDGAPPEQPEDHASKVFNLHRHHGYADIARHPGITRHLCGLLGPDLDCFNSQFIFKNPGAWGQPWHQDSLYFGFDREPQIGMWLATSPATVENGCLFVAPGSHSEPLHVHVPDRRPDANLGYLEVVDHDYTDALPVLMDPGDVLFFHSFLLHKSVDNDSGERRTALVYHYGEPGTRTDNQSRTIDWMPAARENQPA